MPNEMLMHAGAPPGTGNAFAGFGNVNEFCGYCRANHRRWRLTMRILLFSTLFPNAAAPTHGVFVENRLRAYLEKYDADVRVVAPVPWFPFRHNVFGRYGRFAAAPAQENRAGVPVSHPRYLLAPKIGMRHAPFALAAAFRKQLHAYADEGWAPDLIDAHYLYPDGVAAAAVAREHNIPLALTARGSDVTLLPKYPDARSRIVNALMEADAVITVADALKTQLVALGAPTEKITTLRNGVDLETFRLLPRQAIREDMDLSGPVLASVGHLIERKGHDLVIDALQDIPDATLLIVGDGEERGRLKAQAKRLGLRDRIRFFGAMPHQDLINIYNAADALVLASSREGWPNVLLEAMACGAPCVATTVGGNAEVISSPDAGALVPERNAKAIASTVNKLLAAPPDRHAVRAHAQGHSWNETVYGMHGIFCDLVGKTRREERIAASPIRTDNNVRPKLIVTVDTEEIFDWSDFTSGDYRLAPPGDMDAFQTLCEQMNIRPLYFMSYPLLKSSNVSCYFWAKADRRLADCGLHMHPWVTPPFEDRVGEYYSYQKNYPLALRLEKKRALAKAYKAVFGRLATTHRAGRYGVARDSYAMLAEIGVQYDFSPSAGFDFSASGGADFTGYSNFPFRIVTPYGAVDVSPVTGARAIRHTQRFLSQEITAPGFAAPRRRPFTEPARLTPEGASLDTLMALTRRLVADKTPVLTFTLHSTSLTEGANPYAPDAAGVERILTVTRDYLSWFQHKVGGEFVSLDDLGAIYNTQEEIAA